MKKEVRTRGWTGHTKKQTSGNAANKSETLISFLSCSHHSKAEFSEEIWEWSGFAEIKGRKKAESKKLFFTESIHRQTCRGQHVALGEVGSKTCWGSRMGTGNGMTKWWCFSEWTGEEQRMGKGNTVKPMCTGKYRTSGSCQHNKAREKSFYTKLRLESREVCLPVKTFMLHDKMKMAILQRKCVKTLQDSRLGVFCLFFF